MIDGSGYNNMRDFDGYHSELNELNEYALPTLKW